MIYKFGDLQIKFNIIIEQFEAMFHCLNQIDYIWECNIVFLSEEKIKEIVKLNNKNMLVYSNSCIYFFDIINKITFCLCVDLTEFLVSFLKMPIQIIALNNHCFCLHASGIFLNDAVLLFAGPSGVGKSTILNFVSNKYHVFCDDMCIMNANCVVMPIELFVKKYPYEIDQFKNNTLFKRDNEKYFVPIECVSSVASKPYKICKAIFLRRSGMDKFNIGNITNPVCRYLLANDLLMYSNVNNNLITPEQKFDAIEKLKNLEMCLLDIPDIKQYTDTYLNDIIESLFNSIS